MPKVDGARALLNLPGHHSTGAIVAEVVTAGPGRYDTYATVQISDCDRKVTLSFQPEDVNEHENDLHKVDVMIDCLKKFRRGLVKAQKRATA